VDEPSTPPALAGASAPDAPPPATSRGGIPRESFLLVASLFLVVAATNILTPLLPNIQEEFDVSIATVGWVIGAFGLARLILDLPAGWLIDRVGHRRVSIAALVLLVASSLAGLVSPTLEVLLVARVGSGLAVAALATVVLTGLSVTADAASRGKVLGLFPTANNASIMFYPLVGGIIGQVFGWRATFGATAILAVVGGLILVPLLLRLDLARGTQAGGRRGGADEGRVLHGRARAVAIGATGLGVVATMIHRHGFRSTVLPLFAAAALGLGPVQIALGMTVMAVTALFVAVPGGALGDRIGRRQVIFAGLIGMAAADLLFLAAGNFALYLLFAALVGLSDFFPSSQTALLTDVVPPESRTRVLAGYRFAVDVGAFIGPILLAAVMDFASAEAAIVLTAAIMIVAALAARVGVPASIDTRRASLSEA
jgi:MFS family permease